MSAVPEKSKLHERARLRLSECSIAAAQTSAGEPARSWRDNLAPGISTEEQTAIFEPYYRSEGTAALPGIGLGLAISQLLVKQMGGELALRSQLGQGATFTIRLPATNGVRSSYLA